MTWRSLSVRRVAMILGGGTPGPEAENWEGHIPFVTPPDLRGVQGAAVQGTSRTLTEAGLRAGSSLAPKGSVLVSKRAPIGYVAFLKEASAFNQGCLALVPRASIADSRYLTWSLTAHSRELNVLGKGTTFMELSSADLAGYRLPIPNLAEQRAIADYLDRETAKIDTLIEEQQRLVETLARRRQATINRGVFGVSGDHERRDLTYTGRHLAVEPYLVRTPANWPVLRFKALLARLEERNVDLTHPMMSLRITGDVVPRDVGQQQPDEASLPRYLVARPGDLVVNPMWLIGGAIGVSQACGAVSPDYRVFRPKGAYLPRYLHHLLRSSPYRDQYVLYTRAQTTFDRRVQQPELNNMPMPVPPLEEQWRIAAEIDEQTAKIDTLIAESEKLIELSRKRRSALITAAVTGRIDVRGEVA